MLRTVRTTTLVSVMAILFFLVGCSSPSTSTSSSGSSGSSAGGSASEAETPASGPEPQAGGGEDFCAATGEQFDAAKGWMDEKVSPADYLAAIDRTTPLAPPEIAEQVTYVNTTTKTSVQELEAGGDTTPLDVEKMKDGIKAWRHWTELNCSAEIAAKWKD